MVTKDGRRLRHNAPYTFETKADAEAWLVDERRLLSSGDWTPPSVRLAAKRKKPITLGEYAPTWLAERKVKGQPLADRTRDHYQDLLNRFILPTFDDVALRDITPEMVGRWYDTAAATPTYQAHGYSLLRAIMRTAADPTKHSGRPLIPFNPCGIAGGGSSGTKRRIRRATAQEVANIVAAMPERHQLMVLLADGCALRFGELAELRRADVDVENAIIRVRRSVVPPARPEWSPKRPRARPGSATSRPHPTSWTPSGTTWRNMPHPAPKDSCSQAGTPSTWPPARSSASFQNRARGSPTLAAGVGTKLVDWPAGMIFASTTSDTEPSLKPLVMAPPWLSSWRSVATPPTKQPCATSRPHPDRLAELARKRAEARAGRRAKPPQKRFEPESSGPQRACCPPASFVTVLDDACSDLRKREQHDCAVRDHHDAICSD